MQFSKMHGLGNDFMVVDAVTQNVFFSPELIATLASGSISYWSSNRPTIRIWISTTGSLTPTAAKCRSAATARAVLPASSG